MYLINKPLKAVVQQQAPQQQVPQQQIPQMQQQQHFQQFPQQPFYPQQQFVSYSLFFQILTFSRLSLLTN